jgi:hypothetical protein
MVAVVVPGRVVRWSSDHPITRPSNHSVRRLKGDERGAVLVQALLILPILILIVFGGYTVWKVAFVKQSLHSGTYQATRYLCLNPVNRPVSGSWEDAWEEVVKKIVESEVKNNGLAEGASEPVATVTLHGNRLDCGLRFTVETEMNFQIGAPYLTMTLTLRDRHEGRVEC